MEGVPPGFELVEEWSSRTSRLSRFRSAEGDPAELVVKVCDRWGAMDARTSFESARRLAALGGAGGARAIEFVAWSPSPPTLVSEYVGGEELSALVRRAAAGDVEALEARMAAAGALLARAHRLPIPAGARPKSARRVRRRPVLWAGDFAVYNFRAADAGELVYMEPPSKLRVVSAHHDLAWFLASVRTLLPGRRRLVRRLRRAFVRGYRRSSPGAPWGLLDDLRLHAHLLRRHRGRALRNRSRPPTTFPPLPPDVSVRVLPPPERTAPPRAAAEPAPDLVAVLITYGRPEGLGRLVASLAGQKVLPGRVLVVDNGRDPGTAERVRELAARGCEVVLITPPRNVGPAGATALAMTQALRSDPSRSGWIAIHDGIVGGMLEFARAAAREDPAVAAVGRIGHRFDPRWARLHRPPEADRRSLPPVIEVDYLTTGSARAGVGQPLPMFRLDAVAKAGPFWAELFIGMTEVEYGLRLRRCGFRVVANGGMWRQERPPGLPEEAPGRVERTPGRRYYSARNLVVVARVYGRWWTAGWVTATRVGAALLRLARRPGRLGSKHLWATVAGVSDGWRSRLGERRP
jgi:rhamnosyltransferase